jgi:rhomboid protease GluP
MTDEARQTAWVTWLLIAVNLCIFAIELAYGADPLHASPTAMIKLGGNYAPLTIGHHEWWRVMTSMFLHYGVVHVVGNMACLVFLRFVEREHGHAGFASIYLISGLIGGVGSAAINSYYVSAGASGGVYGLFAACGVYLWRARYSLDPIRWRRRTFLFVLLLVVGFAAGPHAKGIDYAAHVFGFVAGLGVALVVHKVRPLPLLLGAIAVACAGLLATPAPVDLDAVLADFHDVEHQCITTYNEKLRDEKANKLGRTDFALALETDILPPWHAMRVRVEAVSDEHIPMRMKPLFALLRTYAKDREDTWRELVAVDRSLAPADQYHADEARVREDVAKLADEMKRLKASP